MLTGELTLRKLIFTGYDAALTLLFASTGTTTFVMTNSPCALVVAVATPISTSAPTIGCCVTLSRRLPWIVPLGCCVAAAGPVSPFGPVHPEKPNDKPSNAAAASVLRRVCCDTAPTSSEKFMFHVSSKNLVKVVARNANDRATLSIEAEVCND